MNSMQIITKSEISAVLEDIDLYEPIKQGFVDYSNGKCVVPPVAELLLQQGEVHIKYGYIKGDEYYVIKVASGFYGNPLIGLPSSNGLLQVFNQKDGQLRAILLDEGILTNERTAVAGALCASQFANPDIRQAAIIGTGIQAKLQAMHLKRKLGINDFSVWGRSTEKLKELKCELAGHDISVSAASSLEDLCRSHHLIVTTTASVAPLVKADWIQPGTHITAIGSDTPDKQELEPALLRKASLVIADSIEQCLVRGEIAHGICAGAIHQADIKELGALLASPFQRCQDDITISDLTGVAVQDIKIAQAVLNAL